jgi:hypothetical protein
MVVALFTRFIRNNMVIISDTIKLSGQERPTWQWLYDMSMLETIVLSQGGLMDTFEKDGFVCITKYICSELSEIVAHHGAVKYG